jgi:hypothetical protein
MSLDMLRVEGLQRIDLNEFRYLINDAYDAAQRQPVNDFLLSSAGTRAFILHGFEPTNPSGTQFQVTKGAAILSRKESGQIIYGCFTTEGDASKNIDMGAFGDGTYYAYIRFEHIPGNNQGRVFWNPAGNGSEISQNMNTRFLANWGLRIEVSSPGPEYLQIAQIDKTGGSIFITDERDFYFEGPIQTDYESDWGGGNDRHEDRYLYGIRDLRTWNSAVRQVLSELKGEAWYRDPVSLDPIYNKVSHGDYFNTEFYISGFDITNPSGTDITIAKGDAYSQGIRADNIGFTETLDDNMDHYIDLDGSEFSITSLALGSPEPAVNGLRLWKAVISGGTMTGTIDYRSNYATRTLQDITIPTLTVSTQHRLDNNIDIIWRNSGDTADEGRVYLDANDYLVLKTGATRDTLQIRRANDDTHFAFQPSQQRFTIYGARPQIVFSDPGDTVTPWTIDNNADALDVFYGASTVVGRFNQYGFSINGHSPSNGTPFGVYDANDALALSLDTDTSGGFTFLNLLPTVANGDSNIRLYDWAGGNLDKYWRVHCDSSDTGNLKLTYRDLGGAVTQTFMDVDSATRNIDFLVSNIGIGAAANATIPLYVQRATTTLNPVARFANNSSDTISIGCGTDLNKIYSEGLSPLIVGTNDSAYFAIRTNGSNRLYFDTVGALCTGGGVPSSGGNGELQIYSPSGTTGRLSFRGATTNAPGVGGTTDTYAQLSAQNTTEGGLNLSASRNYNSFSQSTKEAALNIAGALARPDQTATVNSKGCVNIAGFDNSGTFNNDGNLFTVSQLGSGTSFCRFIVKADGDFLYAGSAATFDTEKDALACQDLSYVLSEQFEKILEYNKDRFTQLQIISDAGFVSHKRISALMLGAISELYNVVAHICDKTLTTDYESLRQLIRQKQEMSITQ